MRFEIADYYIYLHSSIRAFLLSSFSQAPQIQLGSPTDTYLEATPHVDTQVLIKYSFPGCETLEGG